MTRFRQSAQENFQEQSKVQSQDDLIVLRLHSRKWELSIVSDFFQFKLPSKPPSKKQSSGVFISLGSESVFAVFLLFPHPRHLVRL